MNDLILAGDIGGTNLRIALFNPQNLLDPIVERRYPTADYDSLESVLTHFLGDFAGRIGAACFGIAGPVTEGHASLTNIPHWHAIDEAMLRDHLRTGQAALINDMMAMANGVLALPPARFTVLNAGKENALGNVAVIAAGTGLGEGFLHWNGQRLLPSPSEGGHTDFGPTTDLEMELLQYLRAEYGHVSYERILSGPGLLNIYRFLRDSRGVQEPDWLTGRLANGDPGAVISELGMNGESALCGQAIEMFVHIYGSEAGNMALKGLTTGGVYVGGGIAPKILAKLRQPAFMEGFLGKGRFDDLLEQIPVRVIMEPNAPLFGAAYYASLLLAGKA